MRRTVITALLAAVTLVGFTAVPAQAASGQVVVYSTELEPLTTYQDPVGCQQLPATAHVLMNMTDAPIRVYGDPFCVVPATLPTSGIGMLAPGYGTHVTGVGSFRA